MKNQKFDVWGIVELFGHNKIAGRITEQAVGGCSFVRVDVPGNDNKPAFSRLFGNGAIYSIIVTDEETARLASQSFNSAPFDVWSIRNFVRKITSGETEELPENSFEEDIHY